MATPHVSAVAALIQQIVGTSFSAKQVADVIISSADNQSGAPWKEGDGYRYLNAARAVQVALAQKNCSTASITTPVVDSQIGALEYVVAPYQSLNLSTTSSIWPSASYPITGYQWSKGSTGVVAGQNALSATITFDAAGTETVSVAPVLKDGTVCTKSSKSVSITVSQYSKISNAGALVVSSTPAGYGPSDWGCMRDNANGYYYEVKMPSGPRAASRRFTNYTNTTDIQKYISTNTYIKATLDEVSSPNNAITYVRELRSSGLCGRNNWQMAGIAWNFPIQKVNADVVSVWAGTSDGVLYCPFGCPSYSGPPMSVYAPFSPIPWWPQWDAYQASRNSGLGLILVSPPQ